MVVGEEVPVCIYLKLEEGKFADWEIVSRASIELIAAIRELAAFADPTLQVQIALQDGQEGSLKLNTIFRLIFGSRPATEACGQVEFGEIEGAGAEGDEAEATIHVHPKKFGETASVKPPFPSDPHYDAKAWEMCMAKRGPGNVLFWNVAPLPRP